MAQPPRSPLQLRPLGASSLVVLAAALLVLLLCQAPTPASANHLACKPDPNFIPAVIASEPQFHAALANPSVSHIYVNGSLKLTQAYWAAHVPVPIAINRSITIEPLQGSNPFPVFDFSYVNGKAIINGCTPNGSDDDTAVTVRGFELQHIQVRVSFGFFRTTQRCDLVVDGCINHLEVAMPRDFGERFFATSPRPTKYFNPGWLGQTGQVFHQAFTYIPTFCLPHNQSACYSPAIAFVDLAFDTPLTEDNGGYVLRYLHSFSFGDTNLDNECIKVMSVPDCVQRALAQMHGHGNASTLMNATTAGQGATTLGAVPGAQPATADTPSSGHRSGVNRIVWILPLALGLPLLLLAAVLARWLWLLRNFEDEFGPFDEDGNTIHGSANSSRGRRLRLLLSSVASSIWGSNSSAARQRALASSRGAGSDTFVPLLQGPQGIQVGRTLGSGSFGKVFEGMWQSQRVAVKVVLHSQEDCSRVDRELALSADLKHDNVVATHFHTRISAGSSAGGGSSITSAITSPTAAASTATPATTAASPQDPALALATPVPSATQAASSAACSAVPTPSSAGALTTMNATPSSPSAISPAVPTDPSPAGSSAAKRVWHRFFKRAAPASPTVAAKAAATAEEAPAAATAVQPSEVINITAVAAAPPPPLPPQQPAPNGAALPAILTAPSLCATPSLEIVPAEHAARVCASRPGTPRPMSSSANALFAATPTKSVTGLPGPAFALQPNMSFTAAAADSPALPPTLSGNRLAWPRWGGAGLNAAPPPPAAPPAMVETWIVQELCDAGSMADAAARGDFRNPATGRLDTDTVLSIVRDVAGGMAYLHSRNILHGDLKAENVLLCAKRVTAPGSGATTAANAMSTRTALAAVTPGSKATRSSGGGASRFTAKVCDFGLSRALDAGRTHLKTAAAGTVTHMPPELLMLGQMRPAGDVYAFGIMLWELVTGLKAYRGMSHGEVVQAVVLKEQRPEWPQLADGIEEIPEQLIELVSECWVAAPEDRPSFEEVIYRLDCICMPMVVCLPPGGGDIIAAPQPPAGQTPQQQHVASGGAAAAAKGAQQVAEPMEEVKSLQGLAGAGAARGGPQPPFLHQPAAAAAGLMGAGGSLFGRLAAANSGGGGGNKAVGPTGFGSGGQGSFPAGSTTSGLACSNGAAPTHYLAMLAPAAAAAAAAAGPTLELGVGALGGAGPAPEPTDSLNPTSSSLLKMLGSVRGSVIEEAAEEAARSDAGGEAPQQPGSPRGDEAV